MNEPMKSFSLHGQFNAVQNARVRGWTNTGLINETQCELTVSLQRFAAAANSANMIGNVTVPQNEPKISITFRDLNYSVFCGKEEKQIIKNISGEFKAGQISAILGPSGSGKTTLINILSGYKATKVSGIISINKQTRDLQHFHKISRYIMQENTLQPCLTVLDSMLIAADFKLDYRVSRKRKIQMVTDILQTLRLSKIKDNRVEKLSGGERKRLTIALELINNPSVIFLDEPTSGLDEQASFQTISALKQLAKDGKTVICSIHSPSPKTFALFDQVYIMTDGQCVYRGHGDKMLSFLDRIQLTCPVHYNPIDFFIDIASGEYGQQLNNLVALTQNGKLCYSFEKETNCDLSAIETQNLCLENIPEYYTSTVSQLKVLLYRMYLQSYRDPSNIGMKCVMYCIIIILFSAMYYDRGNDATNILSNITFLFLSIIALMYCALMPPLIHFPMEIKIIRSEYFNRWYNITAYFLAKSLIIIPEYVMFTMVYVIITYPLTNQPLAADRMIKFIIICVIVNMIADACSMAVASVFNIVNSFFVGLVIMVPPVGLTVFGFGYPFHMHPLIIQLMLRTSFLRYALEALMDVIYSDRPEHLHCPDSEVLCPLTSPKVIAKVLGYGNANYWMCLGMLIAFYIICKCGHYFLLKQRLKPGMPAELALRVLEFGNSLLIKYLP